MKMMVLGLVTLCISTADLCANQPSPASMVPEKLGTLIQRQLSQLEADIKNNRYNPALEPSYLKASSATLIENLNTLGLSTGMPAAHKKNITKCLHKALQTIAKKISKGVLHRKLSLVLNQEVIDDLNDLPQETQEFLMAGRSVCMSCENKSLAAKVVALAIPVILVFWLLRHKGEKKEHSELIVGL